MIVDASAVVESLLQTQKAERIEAVLGSTDVALAEALDAPLLTCDARLGSAARGRVEVWVV